MQPMNYNHPYLRGKTEEIEQTCWKCKHEWEDEYDLEPNLNTQWLITSAPCVASTGQRSTNTICAGGTNLSPFRVPFRHRKPLRKTLWGFEPRGAYIY